MGKIYDITATISENLPVFPGDPPPRFVPSKQIRQGASCNVTELTFGSHTGTHIDAPYHFEPNGQTVDLIPLDVLVGPCRVIEIPPIEVITAEYLQKIDLGGKTRILFKTRKEKKWSSTFDRSFTYLAPEAAEQLVAKGISLVGIDYLSIEKFGSKDHATHHALLRNNVPILEGLSLGEVKPGDYFLVALPMKIERGDGGPTRVILMDVVPGR